MHIPDGYLSPLTYISGYAITSPLFIYGIKKTKENLSDDSIPLLSAVTALSFLAMMLNIPIPGGTSGHIIGTAAIAILFNPWIAFLAISLVLTIQAFIFGDGGITALAINSFAMGFTASFTGKFIFLFVKKFLNEKTALFLSGWASAVAASIVVALVLGIQPIIASTPSQQPLFFPFGLDVTIPAIVGSHIIYFGITEGVYTMIIITFMKKIKSE
ncbi:MAG: cobalamin biosynthesis protein CbiM [Chlorobi bacterium]|nr:cobalamin biosynthesis protein CbiM [Chlorobiota bacterium]